jgi:Cdc6-like AAA superfamily ATPase
MYLDFIGGISMIDQQNEINSILSHGHPPGRVVPNEKFHAWLKKDADEIKSSVLWVQGDPGTGKTWGVALAMQHLKKNSSGPVAFFYSCYKIGSRKSPIFILRSWISQLIDQSPRAFEAIRNILPESPTGIADLGMMWRAFSEAIKSVGYCHLLLDALDECYGLEEFQNDSKSNTKSITKSGENILWFIYELLRHTHKRHVKILITSRWMEEVGVVLRMRGFASTDISTYTPDGLNISTYTFDE